MDGTPEGERPFDRVGDYEVLAPIAEGGMASVWLGRSTGNPDQFVALKVIRGDLGRSQDFVAMFVDETRIAARLSHANIVALRNVGYDGKRHFLAMEVLQGRTLLALSRAAHAQGRRLPYELVAWIGARIADALHYAHELVDDKGAPEHLVHRDVNPANIFITRDGHPKLIDFGLAKVRDRVASTAIGIVKGKLAYLAPEQAKGHPADRRADIFALGVTLWETSLDRRLFHDETDIQTIRRVRESQVPDPRTLEPGYPRRLADAVGRALAREPSLRWQTAAELRDALDAFVASTGRRVDASSLRALLTDLVGGEPPALWERLLGEKPADTEKTRIWEGTRAATSARPSPRAEAARIFRAARTAFQSLPSLPPKVWATATACAVLGAVTIGLAQRGCRGRDRVGGLEQRVARVEELLGIANAGSAAASAPGVPQSAAQTAVSADDRTAPCAMARIASYEVWQEALAKAKANAASAEATCASIWSDRRKQACYYAAAAGIRTTQAARDAVIAGGAAAREAAKNVKDDPKNDLLDRARSASEAALAACGDDAGL